MLDKTREVRVGKIVVGGGSPLVLIAGICVIEDEEHLFRLARQLVEISARIAVPLIFKASYDKANRTSLDSYRGPGLEKGLELLSRLKEEFGFPLLVDFHRAQDAPRVAETADVLQIPAFLCRQTDLLIAAAQTGRVVNVKKGQFLAPGDMVHVAEKLVGAGCENILLTERGTSFGYHHLVNDMKGIAIMRALGWPVIFDATHSVQLPGAAGGVSGGAREYVPCLARAAVGAGCDGVFMEVHDNPQTARSDAASVVPLNQLEGLLSELKSIDDVVKK